MKAVRHQLSLVLILTCISLVGCGQKGPLTLPKQQPAKQQPAPTAAETMTPASTETQG